MMQLPKLPKHFAVFAVAALFTCFSPEASDTQASPAKILITATLIGADGSPVPEKEVYLFVVRASRLVLNIRDGKLVNPGAKTDAEGRFTIQADPSYLMDGDEFTIGTRNAFFELTTLQRDGFNVGLQFAKGDPITRLDLGRVSY